MTGNRSAPGRGPAKFLRWYEVHLFDGTVFRGRYLEVDFTAKDRAEHILWFATDDGGPEIVEVKYGDLEAAIPLNPTIRKRRGLPT